MLPHKVALALSIDPGQMDGALALPLMNPTTCDTAYFGGIRKKHMHMIGQQMAFLDPCLLLLRQFAKHLSQLAAQFQIQRFASIFRYKHSV